jgi:hypothetical protein
MSSLGNTAFRFPGQFYSAYAPASASTSASASYGPWVVFDVNDLIVRVFFIRGSILSFPLSL